MSSVYLVAAKRTPIGAFCGSLSSVNPANLAAVAIRAVLEEANVPADSIDELILGNVIGAGQGMGPGRQAALAAGLSDATPAYSLNMVCGSGMKTIMDACAHIKAGDADLVIAAGSENMSQIPFTVGSKIRTGAKMGNLELTDLMINDGLTDVFNQYHMGVTAENVVAETGLNRADQDALALASQQKAVAAIEAGRFKDEIAPVEVKSRRETLQVDTDEYPRADATLASLEKLRPAFKKEGSVTAGNASGINDGASAVLVASEEAVKRYNLTPLAEIAGYGQAGIDPKIMGLGPVPAIKKALEKADKQLSDMDLLELNEAFAGQALGVMTQLSEQHGYPLEAMQEKTNVNGGAIALGHPLGASGNRIVVTLLHEMRRRGSEYGLASLCVGGGMGTALILKQI